MPTTTRIPATAEGDRGALVHRYEPLAFAIAKRFAGRGPETEDLRQVALLGLVKAVDRFQATDGGHFSSFAVPTIEGELRHYLRDQGSAVHVPRAVQELRGRLEHASAELTQRLEHAPTSVELADAVGVGEERVGIALRLDQVGHPLSLDGAAFRGPEEEGYLLEECVGGEDPDLHAAEERLAMLQAVRRLPAVHGWVIRFRYLLGMSRTRTARLLGLSDTRVEQYEQWALRELRQLVIDEPEEDAERWDTRPPSFRPCK
jgi:RNA polymerase sigma-B factor